MAPVLGETSVPQNAGADAGIEAAARAMMDGDLWDGAFDGALRHGGQGDERNIWRRRARAAIYAFVATVDETMTIAEFAAELEASDG